MSAIVFATGAVSALGLLCAAILALASKIMKVPEDTRTAEIRDCLPGANCGACGYAGCDGYASALTAGTGVPTNKCVPGGDGVSSQISSILGVDFEDVEEMVAVVKCGGRGCLTHDKMNYEGIKTCAAAKLYHGGKGACSYSCLGYGDCALACPNDAISVSEGVAHVNMDRCTGCGMCARACPKSLIAVIPADAKTVVTCSNTDKGAQTRAVCEGGCIGCGKCVRECTEKAISLENNLAVINQELCSGCGSCAAACVSKCIRFTGAKGEYGDNIVVISSFLLPGARSPRR